MYLCRQDHQAAFPLLRNFVVDLFVGLADAYCGDTNTPTEFTARVPDHNFRQRYATQVEQG